MPQRKGSYYILLETIENFKYIGNLLVEKALKKWGHVCTQKEKWKIEAITQIFQYKRNILAFIHLVTVANACFLSFFFFFFSYFLFSFLQYER